MKLHKCFMVLVEASILASMSMMALADADEWDDDSAQQGDAAEQYYLGTCYASGNVVRKNYVLAVRCYRKAAEQGHVVAQYELGKCYANGDGVKKDLHEAMIWWRKAARQGNAAAQRELERCSSNGEGKDMKVEAKVKAEHEIAEARQSMSCGEYAEAVRHYGIACKLLNEVPASVELRRECDQGVAEGLYRAALQEDKEGRRERAEILMNKALDMRHPKASKVLELWHAAIDENPERMMEQDIYCRMREIRLPAISFKPPATIVDAVDFFRAVSREYDRPDIPMEKRGLCFVLKIPDDTQLTELAPIPTITASDITFYEALKLVCDSVDYKFIIRGPVVMVMQKEIDRCHPEDKRKPMKKGSEELLKTGK